jgi:AcrR family transcriptional regulator
MTRVAEAAGVSKGLVSHYFGDRESLMEQTAIATVAHLRGEVAAAIDLTLKVPDILRMAIHYASQLRDSHTPEMRALDQIVHNLLDAEGAPRLDLTADEDTYRAQEELLRRGQNEGTIRALDTRAAVVTYQAAVDAMIAYLDAHPETDRVQYADALAELLIRALQT